MRREPMRNDGGHELECTGPDGLVPDPPVPTHYCRMCGRENYDGYRRECCGELMQRV